MNRISRREFVTLAALGAVAAPPALDAGLPRQATSITAQEIVDRIRQKLGNEWKAETVDGFKAGEPATAVTGIVTTAMATMVVLKQAVTAGANLIIPGEPTFYSKSDAATPPS